MEFTKSGNRIKKPEFIKSENRIKKNSKWKIEGLYVNRRSHWQEIVNHCLVGSTDK